MGTLPPNSIPGVAEASEVKRGYAPGRYFVGRPDGPELFVPSMGISVPTFTERREDLRLPKDSGMTWLMHHVPPGKRGFFRPHQFADYDPDREYRVDQYGYLLCSAYTLAGKECQKRAVNYSEWCGAHGGKLHPLDKVVDDRRPVEPEVDTGIKPETMERLTRFQKLLSGIITVEDLDDEELSRGQCRDRNGNFTGNAPRNIPAALKDEMARRIFSRVNETFKSDLIGAAKTMMEIATGDAYEPADRINAAKWVIERMMGKTPDIMVNVDAKPWEEIFSGIGGGSRAESRARRGVATDDDLMALSAKSAVVETVDAEVVEEEVDVSDDGSDDGSDDWSNKPGEVGAHHPIAFDYDQMEQQRMFPPPQDPDARHNYERDIARERADQGKTPEERAQELKERINKARSRRYAARANGLPTTRDLGYEMDRRELAAHPGLWRVKWIEPSDTKVPASVKARDTKRRNKTRRGH